MRQEETKAIRVVIIINIEEKNGRRSKMRLLDTIENDMRAVGVCIGDVENRNEWRFRPTPNSCFPFLQVREMKKF
jgi:hypothetical protein